MLKIKRKRKLGGLTTDYLIGFLETLEAPLRFTDFFSSNPIYHKKTFLKYVNWCLERGYIKKKGDNFSMIYSLTVEGRIFLELLK